ncbi:TetR/AcrR family transcriptional regulator [Nocardia gipuzkoensis]|uniref:TetR/AcrR family transcriptional regulator n=1 Tax=Nocardia gipuzkoensis TaxID=2749991 RepID=UPI003EE17054
MTAQRTYGGISAQERRAQRRVALLEAALEIIGTEGLEKLTVSGLCARAGLNERYYYENFDSRDAVLAALIDRIAEELADAILAAVRAAPDGPVRTPDTRATAHAAITAGVHLLTDDPRKAKVALIAGMATPDCAPAPPKRCACSREWWPRKASTSTGSVPPPRTRRSTSEPCTWSGGWCRR